MKGEQTPQANNNNNNNNNNKKKKPKFSVFFGALLLLFRRQTNKKLLLTNNFLAEIFRNRATTMIFRDLAFRKNKQTKKDSIKTKPKSPFSSSLRSLLPIHAEILNCSCIIQINPALQIVSVCVRVCFRLR
jgi:hypothetical protein